MKAVVFFISSLILFTYFTGSANGQGDLSPTVTSEAEAQETVSRANQIMDEIGKNMRAQNIDIEVVPKTDEFPGKYKEIKHINFYDIYGVYFSKEQVLFGRSFYPIFYTYVPRVNLFLVFYNDQSDKRPVDKDLEKKVIKILQGFNKD